MATISQANTTFLSAFEQCINATIDLQYHIAHANINALKNSLIAQFIAMSDLRSAMGSQIIPRNILNITRLCQYMMQLNLHAYEKLFALSPFDMLSVICKLMVIVDKQSRKVQPPLRGNIRAVCRHFINRTAGTEIYIFSACLREVERLAQLA